MKKKKAQSLPIKLATIDSKRTYNRMQQYFLYHSPYFQVRSVEIKGGFEDVRHEGIFMRHRANLNNRRQVVKLVLHEVSHMRCLHSNAGILKTLHKKIRKK